MSGKYSGWAARWRVPIGFLLALAFVVLAQPKPAFLLAGSCIALLGLMIRGYAAGCLNKNLDLATGGPYARTRNPLYLGSLILGLGFAVAGGVWQFAIALLALFVIVYWPVMRREEQFLRDEFGDVYARYSEKVPFFFPALKAGCRGGEPFRWSQYLKNREYRAALGSCLGIAFLVVKMLIR